MQIEVLGVKRHRGKITEDIALRGYKVLQGPAGRGGIVEAIGA